jgi:hypothetical protein
MFLAFINLCMGCVYYTMGGLGLQLGILWQQGVQPVDCECYSQHAADLAGAAGNSCAG